MEVPRLALRIVAVGIAVENDDRTAVVRETDQIGGEGPVGLDDLARQHRAPFCAVPDLDAEGFAAEFIDRPGVQGA